MQNQSGPCAIILTRQALPILEGTAELGQERFSRGAYVLSQAMGGELRAQIIATGSEVQLAVEAQKALEKEGIPVRVISMPSRELFDKQPQSYKDSVIAPESEAALAVETGSPQGWHKYTGSRDAAVMGINRFGASAPAETVMKEYGFTVENVIARVKALLRH